jgi:hypothetical protein
MSRLSSLYALGDATYGEKVFMITAEQHLLFTVRRSRTDRILAARRLCGAQPARPGIQLRFLRSLGYGLPSNALMETSMLGHAGFFTALPIARVQRNGF